MKYNNIISFSDYLKKNKSRLSIDENYMATLRDDIKNRPELMDWYQFQSTFHKHKLFLYSLFTRNQRADNINPNAGFFISFDEEHIDRNRTAILKALKWLDRKPVIIEAKGCTFKNMAKQLNGTAPNNTHDAWVMFEEILLYSQEVIVIFNISQSNIPSGKSWTARSLIKFNDDAHLKGIKPKSDILFVDYAGFLQRSWSELGTYIEICT